MDDVVDGIALEIEHASPAAIIMDRTEPLRQLPRRLPLDRRLLLEQ